MLNNKLRTFRFAIFLSMSIALMACGGGGTSASGTNEKNDNTPPVISLIGDNPLLIEAGANFIDPGSIVTDNIDTTLIATVTGTVNTSTSGSYSLNYNASDLSGNTATTVTRTVNVSSITSDGSELFGKWIYVASGNRFNLYSNSSLTYTKVDNNLIKVDQPDGSFLYAMRAGTSTASASGSVVSTIAAARPANRYSAKLSGVGGISIILRNVNDQNTTVNVTTAADGSFVTPPVLPAGEYNVTVEDPDVVDPNQTVLVEQVVTIDDVEEDLGSYNLVADNTNNFKAKFELVDTNFVYADNKQYYGKIIVENIGDSTSVGVSYSIILNHPSLEYFRPEIVLGSILPGGKKEIPVVFRFSGINEEKLDIPINVTITDINGLQWQEDLNIEVFKEKFYINIRSNTAVVNGYVILPFANKVFQVATQSESIVLPVVADQYKMLLSNPSISTESVYSLGVQRSASLSAGFNSPSVYEPNNEEQTSQTIVKGDQVESYVHVGDLDYWKITGNNIFSGVVNNTGYASVSSNGNYLADTYYYINLIDNTYFNFIPNREFVDFDLFDINLQPLIKRSNVRLDAGTNMFIPAGEYLLKVSGGFSLYSTVYSSNVYSEISANGTYLPNTYYYINLNAERNFDLIPDREFVDFDLFDINLQPLIKRSNVRLTGTNILIPAGEHLLRASSGFTISGF